MVLGFFLKSLNFGYSHIHLRSWFCNMLLTELKKNPRILFSMKTCVQKHNTIFFFCSVDAERCEEILFSPKDHKVKLCVMLTLQVLLWSPRATYLLMGCDDSEGERNAIFLCFLFPPRPQIWE